MCIVNKAWCSFEAIDLKYLIMYTCSMELSAQQHGPSVSAIAYINDDCLELSHVFMYNHACSSQRPC